MTAIHSVTLEVPDPAAAEAFYATAFGVDAQVGVRAFSLAEEFGVSPEGTGSPRIAIGRDAGRFTDPDGFAGEAAALADGTGSSPRRS